MTRFLLRTVLLLIALAVLAAGAAYVLAHRPLELKEEVVDFTVSRGLGMRQAANVIAAAGVDVNPALLSGLARITGRATSIKAGSYEVHRGITPWQIVLKLSDGDVSQAEVLLVEGWTFAQLRRALESHPEIDPDTAGLSDAEILARIGAVESHPEGLFFPDTYLFARRSSDLDVLRRAHANQQKMLEREWQRRADGLPYKTPYEALIMASIVEKETGQAADRPMVASVFINRLRAGMLLQTDPTVIYGLGASFDGNLRKRDLLADTPYNTYTRTGLPPTPIAMPGTAALRAALNPPATDYLYFVARGDGSSEFSRNLDEHNRAVARYIRNRSQ